jgi:Fe-S-cluster containining protein
VENELDAGRFTVWLSDMQAALRGERDADVPCDGCTACCTSSMFIHIEPDELDTLAHIPKELLFRAPQRPHGQVVLGHDERGHCPMLVENRCSIYEHRPRTCRTYDCRVFAATGLDAADGDERKSAIAQRVERWRFDHRAEPDRADAAAVRDAAVTIRASMPDLTNAEVAARAVLLRTGEGSGE